MQRNTFVLLVTLAVAVTVGFGAATVAAADHATVAVDQEPGEPATVTVTDANNESVANASVSVAVDNQSNYDGTGNYTTDVNGTVELPAPEETIDVTVTATVDNGTVSTTATLEALPELDITVEQDAGSPATVTVTAADESVENATVDVEPVDENATYAGANVTYTTDENGTAELPAPEETIEVVVTATEGDRSVSVTTTLEATPTIEIGVEQLVDQPATVTVTANGDAAANATVDVEAIGENATYAGVGAYTTDQDGIVELPAPEETVDVTITATYQGGDESVVETLEALDTVDDDASFGQVMAAFVTEVRNGTNGQLDGPFGHVIATFAVQNNPGNAPAHAGPPENATQGPPDHAGPSDDDDRGPPAHAGPGDDGDSNETTEQINGDEDSENATGETDDRGPPAHAGPGNDGDDERGPPAHAGPDDGDSDEDDESDDRGPPAHAGPDDGDSDEDDTNDETDSEEGADNSESADDADDDSGPPDHAGPGGNDGGGPPGNAGPP